MRKSYNKSLATLGRPATIMCFAGFSGELIDFSGDLGHEQKTRKLKGAAKDSQESA